MQSKKICIIFIFVSFITTILSSPVMYDNYINEISSDNKARSFNKKDYIYDDNNSESEVESSNDENIILINDTEEILFKRSETEFEFSDEIIENDEYDEEENWNNDILEDDDENIFDYIENFEDSDYYIDELNDIYL